MEANYIPVANRTFTIRLRNLGYNIERKNYGFGVFIKEVG
jgi:hypothetical protein